MDHASLPRPAALLALAVCLAACPADEPVAPTDRSPVPRTGGTGDTGPGTTAPPAEAMCVADHALRGTCSWSDLPGPATLSVERADDTLQFDVEGPDGSVLVEGLRPETDHPWVLDLGGEQLEGVLTTPPVAQGALVAVDVGGTPSFHYVGMKSPCGDFSVVVVLDVDPELEATEPTTEARPGPDVHRVVAYEDVATHQAGFIEGVSFTEDDTMLAVTAFPGGILELDRSGAVVQSVPEDAFHGPPHHDVFRRDGLTYVLVQDFTEGVYLDAVQVFDAAGRQVALWRLGDHIDPVVDGFGYLKGDYSHANSIWVDDAGDWYLSSRHLSAVFKIAGLDAPDAGAVRWILAGDPNEVRIEGTLQLLDGESFVRQHNVHLTPSGHLAMFDNRRMFPELSRMLWLSIDEEAGTARVEEAWTLPVHCPFQGGAWSTPTGNALATCAPQQIAFEFAPGVPDPVAHVAVTCATTSTDGYVPRMVPLDAW